MSSEVYLRRRKAPLLMTFYFALLLLPAVIAAPSIPSIFGDGSGVGNSESLSAHLSSGSSIQKLINSNDFSEKSSAAIKEDSQANVQELPKIDSAESNEVADKVEDPQDDKDIEDGGKSGSSDAERGEAANPAEDASHPPSGTVSTPNKSTGVNSSEEYNVVIRTFNTGAVWRGFLVFVACSVVVVLYFGIRTACRRRGRGQRRYHKVDRGDELDVFPLTEADDDDEEIFSADVQR